MDRREHHRAQLRLPVRIRWNTPFGQKIEICKTLDISRGGLLVPAEDAHAPGVPMWVTFPYDTSLGDGQPEILAKVVRARPLGDGNGGKGHEGNSNEQAVALHFSLPARATSNGNGHTKQPERRESPRRALAVPVRVRPEHIPWFEEAMTLDVSTQGMRFVSNREYQAGERLLISFEASASAPWPAGFEVLARVARVEAMPGSVALAISISRQT
jgi:hypothetical protein